MTDIERQELVLYRIERAHNTFREVNLLIQNQLWVTDVNRLYYACYYAVSALLLKYKYTAQTHAGIRQLFGLHFIKTGILPKELGKFYSEIFNKRITGDYDDFIEYKKEDVIDLLEPANQLILQIEKLLE